MSAATLSSAESAPERTTAKKPGWFGLLTFNWVNGPIADARRKKQLDLDALYLPEENLTEQQYGAFAAAWSEQAERARATRQSRPLLRVLLRIYGRAFFLGGLCKLVWSVLCIFSAYYFVKSLLYNVKGRAPYGEHWKGYVLSVAFFCGATTWGLALQRMGYICMSTGVKVRAVLLTAVTRKAISMSKVDAELSGDIVTFVANDIGKVYDGMQEFHYLWTAPFEAIGILALVGVLMGMYVIPGVAIVAIVLAVQYYFGYLVAQNQYKNSLNTYARQGVIQEALPAIKLIKYYGWERFFEAKINDIRALETAFIARNNVMKAINIVMVFLVPPSTAFCIFTWYEFDYQRINSTLAFVTLSLFNILRFPLVVLPKALRALSEGLASLSRVEEFLLKVVEHEEKQHQVDRVGIEVSKGVFQYEGEGAFTLHVPELRVAPGEVVAIVGRVGCGKTALLQALLGNMECKEGDIAVGGRIAFVPQTPWIQNLSIRDNVLFGNAVDEERYREVLQACALDADLKVLPQGDASVAGLRGLNLSGGQRQRVNLARAAYFDADTVLLDNALSAVDHHTAEHIFNHVIKGLFKRKAVVLITHQLCFLRRCDKVVIMDGGKFEYFGAFNAEAAAILARYLPIPTLDDPAAKDEAPPPPLPPAKAVVSEPEARVNTKLGMAASTWTYLKTGGLWKFALAFVIAGIAIGNRQAGDFWIRFWVSDHLGWYPNATDHGNSTTLHYSLVYLSFVFGFFFFSLVRSIFFLWGTFTAAKSLHAKMLRRVLNTPMAFFLAKPVGELMNNFSYDQNKADEVLPDTVHFALVYFFVLLATSITVSINIPEFAAFAGALAIVTCVMLALYLPAASQVKKMRADTAGSLVGLTAEVLEGLPVIQAYSHEKFFVDEFRRQTDAHHRALFNADTLNLWIAFYCDFYGAVMILAVSLFAVSQRSRGASVVGLAFSNTIQLLVFYTWTVRLITEAISLSSAIEQLTWLAYHTPIDGKDDVNNVGQKLESDVKWKQLKHISVLDPLAQLPDESWPSHGSIVFEDVQMRYRPTANLALAGVTLSISHGEKVGIVGRTGSGKSTLLLVLYRMFELAGGRVLVSGVDVASLPLKRMRRGLAVIPQEPVMFTGSLRSNLDPYNLADDAELLALLKAVGLDEQAAAAGGLGGTVAGSGSKCWSLGQMQLVCLVRAALNKTPIVCLDEATAAMDPHTEKYVLEAIHRLFSERTVLTIAHRLDAVIQADTVVVMDAGRVAETGPPSVLLADATTHFSRLVDMSGPTEAMILRDAAAKTFARRSMRLASANLGSANLGSANLDAGHVDVALPRAPSS